MGMVLLVHEKWTDKTFQIDGISMVGYFSRIIFLCRGRNREPEYGRCHQYGAGVIATGQTGEGQLRVGMVQLQELQGRVSAFAVIIRKSFAEQEYQFGDPAGRN